MRSVVAKKTKNRAFKTYGHTMMAKAKYSTGSSDDGFITRVLVASLTEALSATFPSTKSQNQTHIINGVVSRGVVDTLRAMARMSISACKQVTLLDDKILAYLSWAAVWCCDSSLANGLNRQIGKSSSEEVATALGT